jgi:hypothetical protein
MGVNLPKVASTVFYGPSDWLVDHTTARDRRSFGCWTLVIAIVGAVFFGRAVLYVTILSLLALMPNLTAETPVEEEGGD